MSDASLSLRPFIETESAASHEEQFQNQTLRPVLKMKNGALVRVFRQYITQTKNTFYRLGSADQIKFISNALSKDIKLSALLRGMVLGHFTNDEWEGYLLAEAEINRRMSRLIEQRLISNLADLNVRKDYSLLVE